MRVGVVGTLLCLAGCVGGSETGNPFDEVVAKDVALEVRASTSAYAIGGGAADTVITEAWVSFGGRDGTFVFPAAGECGADFLDGAYPAGWWSPLAVVDLASDDARVAIDVPLGPRCGVAVPLMKETPAAELPDGAPDALRTHSVVVRGERADGTPFVVLHDEDDELELVAVDGTFEVRQTLPLLLSFEIERWMGGIDLDAATPDADGVITIARGSNDADLVRFERQAECALDFYADEDGDGVVGSRDTLLARNDDPEDACEAP